MREIPIIGRGEHPALLERATNAFSADLLFFENKKQKMFHMDTNDLPKSGGTRLVKRSDFLFDKVTGLRFYPDGNGAAWICPNSKNGNTTLDIKGPVGFVTNQPINPRKISGWPNGTWFFVASAIERHSSSGNALFFGPSAGNGQISFNYDDSGINQIAINIGGRTLTYSITTQKRIGWSVWAITVTQTGVKFYRDGVEIQSTASSGIATANTSNQFGIASNQFTANAMRCILGEYVFFAEPFNAAEIKKYSKHLQNKWDINDRRITMSGETFHFDAYDLDGSAINQTLNRFCGEQTAFGLAANMSSVSGTSANLTFAKKQNAPAASFGGNVYISSQTASTLISSNDYAVLLVTEQGTQVDAYANIFDWSHADAPVQNIVLQRDNTSDVYNLSHFDTSGGSVQTLASDPFPIGTRIVYGAIKNGTDMIGCINDGASFSSVVASTVARATRSFRIAGNSSFSRSYVGLIHELAIISGTVSESTMRDYVRQLMNKWKV